MTTDGVLTIAALRRAYRSGALTPTALVELVLERLAGDDAHRVWISRFDATALRAQAQALEGRDPATLPLYGVPFAVKDNIDVAGLPTTAACPAFAYRPSRHATVVQRLLDAGAIVVGKTNLDQFATGLNGTRSPYGACRNAFQPDYISGGSSSGSAVAVALGQVAFALGTDTAGSGRVPAALQHLVGHKPTRGVLPASGVVPACRSLDTVSIFAHSAADAQCVLAAAMGADPGDAFSRNLAPHGFDFGGGQRFRFGVPREADLEFFGNAQAAQLFALAVQRLQQLGGEPVVVDLSPFLETARLLYGGPWVAERYAAIRDLFDVQPEAIIEPVRSIIDGARRFTAADAFVHQYRLRELQQTCHAVWRDIDVLLTPTTPTVYRIDEVLAQPVQRNTDLGYYTNFVNLLDYAATAVPVGWLGCGVPWGVTLVAPAHQDGPLLHLAQRLHALADRGLARRPARWDEGAHARADVVAADAPTLPDGRVRLAVVGAHLSGLPLNVQLQQRAARLVASTTTAPLYRLYALPDGMRPGLVRVPYGGRAIACEVWELHASAFGSFVAAIPAPLGIGKVQLADGSQVCGFLCEEVAVREARDITAFGGWRAWLAHCAAQQ